MYTGRIAEKKYSDVLTQKQNCAATINRLLEEEVTILSLKDV